MMDLSRPTFYTSSEVAGPTPLFKEPSVKSFLCGLVSKRWLLLTACCLLSYMFPYFLHTLEEEEQVTATAPGEQPDFASIVFVIAVATTLADLQLFPRFYRPPPRFILLIYDLLVSIIVTRWALWATWQPFRSLTHTVVRTLERRCVRATTPPGWIPGRRRARDAMWAVMCDAASPLPAASRIAEGALVLISLACYAAVLHATELIPRLHDYYDDWTQARQYLAMEKCSRQLVSAPRAALPRRNSS